jgi:TPP-dependent trihydroxycyclohexane-1,2-dione (THcHDO) dehydratase
MARPLHVGVIGVGRIGALHVQTLRVLDGVSGLTLADADAARARNVATEFGVHAADSPEQLVEVGVDRVPSYESWWDVAVAEISEVADVRAARERYEAAREEERSHL